MKLKQTLLLVIITVSMSYGCKAQQIISAQQQINTYSSAIIGTWIDEEDNNYKLEFLSNGTCKEYDGSVLITTYNYSIVNSNCGDFNSSSSFYLKWIDTEDLQTTCLEILNITDDVLSLMIIDKAERLFLNKQ